MIKDLKKWYYAFGFQGSAYGLASLIVSLFVVVALNGNVASASVAMAMFSLGNLLGSLFTGIFLDKYPRFFELVFLSASVDGVTLILMGFTKSILIYYLLSMTFGFFLSIMSPTIVTYLNRKFDESIYRKEISTLNLFNSVGITIGIFLGGAWLTVSIPTISNETLKMRSIFLLSALLFGISALFASFYLRKKMSFKKIHRSRKFNVNLHSLAGNIMALPHNVLSPFNMSYFKPETKRYMFGLFIVFLGANMFFTPFPIFLKKVMNIPSGYIFIIYGINNLFTNMAYLFTNKAMERFRDMSIMSVVLWIRITMFLAIALSIFVPHFGLWITLSAFMAVGFTWPFFYIPATIQATNLAMVENRGKIMGLFNMVINLGAISASFIAGYLALKLGYVFSFSVGSLLLFLGDRILAKIAKTHPIREEFLKERRKFLNDIIKRKRKKAENAENLKDEEIEKANENGGKN
ncbi:MFS transporter [Mesoaciditoga sp.]